MLSTAYSFLFIHVPKTGGNSIQKALLPFSDDRVALLAPYHDGIDRFEIRSPQLDIHKHSNLRDYNRQLDPEVFARLTKVACVRNPWDRCVSFFFSPHRGAVTWSPSAFEDFIKATVHTHAHYLGLDSHSNDPFDNIDMVMRFERLTEDFNALCDHLKIGSQPLSQINSSNREHYRSYFTSDRLIDLVAEKFASEIARFSYQF